MSHQHHVFLSYSRKDTELMQRVRADLLTNGLSVWTDEGIEPGTTSWRHAIEDAIENSGCVVVIASPEAKQSEWVRRELSYAQIHEKKIYPVLARGEVASAIPIDYSESQWIDIRQNYSLLVVNLIPSITKYLNVETVTQTRERLAREEQRLKSERQNLEAWEHKLGQEAANIQKAYAELEALSQNLANTESTQKEMLTKAEELQSQVSYWSTAASQFMKQRDSIAKELDTLLTKYQALDVHYQELLEKSKKGTKPIPEKEVQSPLNESRAFPIIVPQTLGSSSLETLKKRAGETVEAGEVVVIVKREFVGLWEDKNTGFESIKAPVSGKIIEFTAHQGDVIRANQVIGYIWMNSR